MAATGGFGNNVMGNLAANLAGHMMSSFASGELFWCGMRKREKNIFEY